MSIIRIFNKPTNELETGGRQTVIAQDANEPSEACPNCHKQIPLSQIWGNDFCCVNCSHHFRMSARQRLHLIADDGSFLEFDAALVSEDFLEFPDTKKSLKPHAMPPGSGSGAVRHGGNLRRGVLLFVMEPFFMMGSMGTAVGEKITRLFEYAVAHKMPVVGFTVSGGARMQEGIVSLMQMAKTSGAVKWHSNAGLLYITVLTDPTTGGVTASFAMEGDIILAEPGATVGFAGARVIEQTTRKKLPTGFQTSEFLMAHGFVDAIVPRSEQRKIISELIKLHAGGEANAKRCV